jgi:hypothetical protein
VNETVNGASPEFALAVKAAIGAGVTVGVTVGNAVSVGVSVGDGVSESEGLGVSVSCADVWSDITPISIDNKNNAKTILIDRLFRPSLDNFIAYFTSNTIHRPRFHFDY